MNKKHVIIALAAVLTLTVGAAVATPSRGYVAKLLGATTIDSLSIEPDGPSTALFVRAQIEAGGTTGWHSHPAHVFVLVKQGRVAIIEEGDCARTVYRPGEIFMETPGHVHKALNVGDDGVVLVATFVGMTPGAAPTTDEANPCRG